MDKTGDTKMLLDQVTRFRREMVRTSGSGSGQGGGGSTQDLDQMIVNLGNPRLAEKMRIHKVDLDVHLVFLKLTLTLCCSLLNLNLTKSRKK